MQDIVGEKLRLNEQTIGLAQADFASYKYVGFYFGAHWAPPCRLFTTQLLEWLPKINEAGKNLAVFFVSIDGNEAAFERNYKEMTGFFAIPYADEARISSLKQRFGINGIPTMIVTDN